MVVYKFGGASIESPERMKALLPILTQAEKPLLLVVSAYGKTTNALENIISTSFENKTEALALVDKLLNEHLVYANQLLSTEKLEVLKEKLQPFYQEIIENISNARREDYNFIYDQIVSKGELFSTTIFNLFLQDQNNNSEWIDARSIIKTDDTYRDPKVNLELTNQKVQTLLVPMMQEHQIVVTQGFIGSTESINSSVTLGREGSDYSAALLTTMLGVNSLTIWKDVEGFKNADPKLFANTQKLDELTYHEVIELAYYGAQIIHPKTIKPLQNANIPLLVKCFLDPSLKGTVISNTKKPIHYPPLIVLKSNQVLLQLTTRDFSFITEDNLSKIYEIFHRHHLKINVIQNAAISLVVGIDNLPGKVMPLIDELQIHYKVLRNEQTKLLTIRHYTPEIIKELTANKKIILEQKSRHTIQLIMK